MAAITTPTRTLPGDDGHPRSKSPSVQLGPRPYFLVDDMDEGPLKEALRS